MSLAPYLSMKAHVACNLRGISMKYEDLKDYREVMVTSDWQSASQNRWVKEGAVGKVVSSGFPHGAATLLFDGASQGMFASDEISGATLTVPSLIIQTLSI